MSGVAWSTDSVVRMNMGAEMVCCMPVLRIFACITKDIGLGDNLFKLRRLWARKVLPPVPVK